jgi:hypothetical protein
MRTWQAVKAVKAVPSWGNRAADHGAGTRGKRRLDSEQAKAGCSGGRCR